MSAKESPYLVHCRNYSHCGKDSFLSDAEYSRQMMRPNKGWICPECGHDANWDDANYDKFMGQEEDWQLDEPDPALSE